MFRLQFFTVKKAALAITLLSLLMTGNAQAHHDDDEYLSLAPLILYNVLFQPLQHEHHYYSEYPSYGQHHGHYQKPRRHNYSYDRYSQKRLIKKHRRH